MSYAGLFDMNEAFQRAARNGLGIEGSILVTETQELEPSAFSFTRILRSSRRRRILRPGIERGWLRLRWRRRRMFGLRPFATKSSTWRTPARSDEVGRIFGQEDEARPDGSDGLSHPLSLVGAEIVEDHDVARLEGRREELFDIGAEAFAVDRAVEQAGRIDASFEERQGTSRSSTGHAGPCRRGALLSAPSRAAGSCWFSSRSRR